MKFETMKIADLISEISMGPFGSNIKVECFVDEGIPVLNGSNLDGFVLKENSFRCVTEEKADSLGKANAHRGDVVVTHRGTLGQIVFIPQDSLYDRYVISQSQFRVRCNERVLPEYLVYYFHTRIGQHKLLSNASQVGVPALARASTTFQTIEIEVPDLETQRKIIDLLETIRRKVKVNNEINENLLQQAQSIFTQEFLTLDCTPDGWQESSLLGVADYLNGLAMQKYRPTDDEQGLPVLKIKELRQGYCDSNSELCSPSIKPEYIVHDGDVIFSWSGSLLVDFWCGSIWLTQKMMAALYDVSVAAISQHIKRIYEDGELMPEATIKKYLTVQSEGGRQVSRNLDHYNLQMIIAVGFKVNNQRAVQFRKWAGQIVKDYTIQGWTMDKERLKNGHMFTDEYFDRQLQYIREIRLSERKFYQKVTDLYATAFDYDKDAKTTRLFFQTVQNKMHFAVHRHTAAELIVERADARKAHMGLTTWGNAPDGKIIKADVTIAKNYFDARAKLHLQEYLNSRTDDNPALFVTLRSPHERIRIGGIEHRLREMGKRLNIPKVHPHKFRRTLATMAIDKGMPIEQLQRLLGHQRIDTTLQYAMVKQSNVKTAHRKYIG